MAGPVVSTPAAKKLVFKVGELVVYPAHGVGRIIQIEEQEIAGAKLELYIVDFEKEKLRLKVPTGRAEQKGMRRLSDKAQIDSALKVLKGRARIKRTMWSRRAQEYDAKINSGDIMAVAEVVRDLYRSERQPEQSYSERQLFEQALDRMAREIAAVRKLDDDMAIKELEDYLAKNARRTPVAADKAEDDIPAEEAA
jgi:CarD family transcriptional regulator